MSYDKTTAKPIQVRILRQLLTIFEQNAHSLRIKNQIVSYYENDCDFDHINQIQLNLRKKVYVGSRIIDCRFDFMIDFLTRIMNYTYHERL